MGDPEGAEGVTQLLQEVHQEAKEDVTKEDEGKTTRRRVQRIPTAIMLKQALKDLEALDFNKSKNKPEYEDEEDISNPLRQVKITYVTHA